MNTLLLKALNIGLHTHIKFKNKNYHQNCYSNRNVSFHNNQNSLDYKVIIINLQKMSALFSGNFY